MQRTEAEVVARTCNVIKEYEQNPDVLNNLDITARVRARIILEELKNLTAPFATSDTAATQSRLKSLEDGLRKCNRWVVGGSLLYSYHPASIVSKACIALAEDLATIFPYEPLRLLLPKVMIPNDFKTKHYNNFVVTPDRYLIGIVEGLDAVRNRSDRRYVHPTGTDLNPDLLIEHSVYAANYAAKIRHLVRPTPEDIAECDKARAELVKYIDECTDYQREKPAHRELDGESLTKKIQTPQQLAEWMDAHVRKNEWGAFLSAMPRDELCRIIIPKRGQTPQKTDQTDIQYNDEQTKAALLAISELAKGTLEWPASDNVKRILNYLLIFLYHELRSELPEYLDSAGGWLGGTSKKQAKEQAEGMLTFLLSEENMLDVERWLLEKNIPVISSPTCLALKNKILEAGHKCVQQHQDKCVSVAAPGR